MLIYDYICWRACESQERWVPCIFPLLCMEYNAWVTLWPTGTCNSKSCYKQDLEDLDELPMEQLTMQTLKGSQSGLWAHCDIYPFSQTCFLLLVSLCLSFSLSCSMNIFSSLHLISFLYVAPGFYLFYVLVEPYFNTIIESLNVSYVWKKSMILQSTPPKDKE